jgi:hypothetical protein
MDAFGMIYPQYWKDKSADANFERHIKVLKGHYGTSTQFSTTAHPEGLLHPMLSPATLDMQTTLFKLTMRENATSMLKKPFTINPVTRMWMSIDGNSYLRHSLSEFLKVAELGIVMVLGSVQDERTFSTVTFIKTKFRNRLTTHLPLVVDMKSQKFFNIQTFPYDSAYENWRDASKRQCDIE